MRRVEMVYLQAEEGSLRSHKVCFTFYTNFMLLTLSYPQRRPTALSPLTPETRALERQDAKDATQGYFKSKRKLVSSMSMSVNLTALDLLVSVSGMLEAEHYPKLGPVIWHECLLDPNGATAASVGPTYHHSYVLSNFPPGLFSFHAVR